MIPYSNLTDLPSDNVTLKDGNVVTYEAFVTNLVKQMNSRTQNLCHMALGITGEAGELADAIKKHWAYEKELNLENAVEELGDLEFYMAGMRQILGVTRRDVLNANVVKLQDRYKNGYSNEAAINREDKNGTGQVIVDPSLPVQPPFTRKYDDGQLVDSAGMPLPSVELHIVDMGTPMNPDDEAVSVVAAGTVDIRPTAPPPPKPMDPQFSRLLADTNGEYPPDYPPMWLVNAIKSDMGQNGQRITAFHIHKGTATVLNESGVMKMYYPPDADADGMTAAPTAVYNAIDAAISASGTSDSSVVSPSADLPATGS